MMPEPTTAASRRAVPRPSAISLRATRNLADFIGATLECHGVELVAAVMDFVFTVCDQAAGEICPVWPGNPITAHWGVPDPAAVEGTESERKRAFRDAYHQLDSRIRLFIALPIDKLDRMALKRRTDEIGREGDDR